MKTSLFVLALCLIGMSLSAQRFTTIELDDERFEEVSFDSLDIEDNDDFSSFSAFDSIVADKRVFFTGENHRFRYSNTKLQLKMLQYLYKKAGVRYLMMEFGYGRGWLVDKYINSEDSTLYDILLLYSYKEYADFYKNIRTYNLTLPEDDRIHVIGMDMERFTHLPAKVLSMQLPDGKAIPETISLHIEALRAITLHNDELIRKKKEEAEKEELSSDIFLSSFKQYSTRKTINTLIEDVEENDSIYKAYLADNYDVFKRVLNELKDHETYESYSRQPHMYIYRERYMYTKFMSFIKEQPEAKIFGQFGRCHIAKQNLEETCPWQHFQAFATRLNEDSLLSESVLSFGIYYPNGLDFYRMEESNPHIVKLAKRASSEGVSYARISKDTSLFGGMTDFFDFILINNTSIEEEKKMLDDQDDPYGGNFNSDFFVSINFGYNQTNQEMSATSRHMRDLGYEAFDTPLSEISISATIGEKGGHVQKYDFTFTSGFEANNPGDSVTAEIGGFQIMLKYGWDLFNSEHFSVQPFIGLGYSNYTMTINQDAARVTPRINTLGDPLIEKYNNASFMMDASVDALFNVGMMGFGGTIGYRHDFVDKRWKGSDGELAPQSPELSASALYYGFIIAIIF